MKKQKKNSTINLVCVLGTGTSTGVPTPGCSCSVCNSPNQKNKRFRTSVLLQPKNGKNILIDTTPDLRSQVLANNITVIDAAIITHDHADHLHGIDDLRPFCFGPPKKTIPVITSDECAQSLETRFPYIFKSSKIFSKNRPIIGGGIPRLKIEVIKTDDTVKIFDEKFTFFLNPHGHINSLGLIHEKFAYIVDCHSITNACLNHLRLANLDLLIIDCLKPGEHSTHLTLDKALFYIDKIGAKKSGLIHLSHHLEHQTLSAAMQKKYGNSVFPLYDGQILEYQCIE